ncbi:PREDICTED: uncharacterized protein LOC109167348 [Ipomoea nil]|uniref:uncharacterized protein LOC109167348 n=1 Tax=Ipomoea nil TaxID=35883 RepID=UPI00090160B6|nr:PREDICTED: uncharacterized protein LOC109167348 [Ipomoea nil]
MWKPKGNLELIAIANEYFLVRFSSIDDLEFAMYEGPWMVLDHYLIMKPWEPDFDPYNDATEKILAWVRVPSLPAEYYNSIFLRKLGNRIGRIVGVDQATSQVSRGMFARFCVELDMRKPLVSKFTYAGKVRYVAYEGMHMVCFACGLYGHEKEACLDWKRSSPAADGDMAGNVEAENSGGPSKIVRQDPTVKPEALDPKVPFGSWMLAPTRRGRPASRKPDNINKLTAGQKERSANRNEMVAQASKFALLAEDNDVDNKAV